MRQIKFRGLTIDTNEWVYGYFIKCGDETFIEDEDGNVHKVKPKTVGQSTGLRDIKDIKDVDKAHTIFEDDIVQIMCDPKELGVRLYRLIDDALVRGDHEAFDAYVAMYNEARQ
jgi:hypothetical protein